MSCDCKYYVGDVGTEIIVETGSDISQATVTKLMVKKPNGVTTEWLGVLEELTKIKYVVQAGDWDQKGIYLLQAYVQLPTWSGRGDTTSFEILEPFK